MSHQDKGRHSAWVANHQALRQALEWLLRGAVLSELRFRRDATWSPLGLMATALLWAWSDEKTLKERFFTARKIAQRAWGWPRQPATSYQALLKMLRQWTPGLAAVLVKAFRERMRQDLSGRFLLGGYALFGVDGSRLELARTASNEQRFAAARGRRKVRRRKRGRARDKPQQSSCARQKKAKSPQMWLTVLWHVGSGLPWDWRTGASGSSERAHLEEMLPSLPPGALLTADAGFVGYDGWKALRESGRHLLVRVGANVRLLKSLGRARERHGLVWLWPDRAAAQHQPPLLLRLVVVETGRHPMYLVTSILDQKMLSDRQVARLYGLRWGVELFYRHFKQTFERRKLRSHAADNVELEATWSLLGLWALCLHAECELARHQVPASRLSVAGVLRAYRKPMREYKSRPDPGEDLSSLLCRAVIDGYQRRSKNSRNYPRKKQQHAIGVPQILKATRDQVDKARAIRCEIELRLTA